MTNQVPAESEPNWAAFGIDGRLEGEEQAGFTTVYDGSKTRAVDALSFYFACVANTQAATGIAVGCTIRVTGVKASTSEEVPAQFFTFVPGTAGNGGTQPSAAMAFAELGPQFKGLSDCRQEIVATSLSPVLPGVGSQSPPIAIRVDNLLHINYYSS